MEKVDENVKNSWGGARKGAGRKKSGVKYYGFLATQEAEEILSKVEGSKAAFINRCILEYGSKNAHPSPDE